MKKIIIILVLIVIAFSCAYAWSIGPAQPDGTNIGVAQVDPSAATAAQVIIIGD